MGHRLAGARRNVALGAAIGTVAFVAGGVWLSQASFENSAAAPSPTTANAPAPTSPPVVEVAAELVVDSFPQGAFIALDSREIGRTPARLADLPPGAHRLEMKLAGYATWSSEVVLGSGDTESRMIRLEPLPGSLRVMAIPDGAAVLVDGEPHGEAPLTLSDLSAGFYRLRVEKEGFLGWEASLWLAPGQSREVDVELQEVRLVAAEPPENRGALAVIVENSPAARPQSGLHRADVVYEALAEGGISRFLALYLSGEAPVVGPIRSARHYFVSWARDYGAALVNIGASPQGHQAIAASGLLNLDEGRGHPGFWRSRARRAPHNAYSSTDAMRSALLPRGLEGDWGGLAFKEPSFRYEGEPAEDIAINYGWNYRVGYVYDPESNTYSRVMAGRPHLDAESGEQIEATTVVAMFVSSWVIDAEGRLDMQLYGSGTARYFIDGVHLEGTWHRSGPNETTLFLDADGAPVSFNAGHVWIQVLPSHAVISY